VKRFLGNSSNSLKSIVKIVCDGRGEGETWQFPLPVFLMFAFVILAEFCIGCFLFGRAFFKFLLSNNGAVSGEVAYLFAFFVLLSYSLFIFSKNIEYVVQLLAGRRTIENYFWQFFPFRILYINQVDKDALPFYRGRQIDIDKIEEEWKKLKEEAQNWSESK
jgi:hypothetical protein